MGAYDMIEGEVNGATVRAQVKIWDNSLAVYTPGDAVRGGPQGPYSVRLQEGYGWANVNEENRYTGISAQAEHETCYSKWGGPVDERNPVEVALENLGDTDTPLA